MIKSNADVERFERLAAQFSAFRTDIETLSKKKPDAALNPFKIQIANQLLSAANSFLGKERMPLQDFELFDESSVPTNSDVVVVFSQYRKALRRLLDANTEYFKDPTNYGEPTERRWLINGKMSAIPVSTTTF